MLFEPCLILSFFKIKISMDEKTLRKLKQKQKQKEFQERMKQKAGTCNASLKTTNDSFVKGCLIFN